MASAEPLPPGLWLRAAELPRTRVSTSDRLSDVLTSCDAPRALCFAPESEDALFSDAGEAGALAEGWARSCGAVSTPLHFCEQDVLAVNLGPGGGLRAALFPPEDLPFLAVHHGGAALRTHSAVADACGDALPLLAFPELAHASRRGVELGALEGVAVPAGWFLQLSSLGEPRRLWQVLRPLAHPCCSAPLQALALRAAGELPRVAGGAPSPNDHASPRRAPARSPPPRRARARSPRADARREQGCWHSSGSARRGAPRAARRRPPRVPARGGSRGGAATSCCITTGPCARPRPARSSEPWRRRGWREQHSGRGGGRLDKRRRGLTRRRRRE